MCGSNAPDCRLHCIEIPVFLFWHSYSRLHVVRRWPTALSIRLPPASAAQLANNSTTCLILPRRWWSPACCLSPFFITANFLCSSRFLDSTHISDNKPAVSSSICCRRWWSPAYSPSSSPPTSCTTSSPPAFHRTATSCTPAPTRPCRTHFRLYALYRRTA